MIVLVPTPDRVLKKAASIASKEIPYRKNPQPRCGPLKLTGTSGEGTADLRVKTARSERREKIHVDSREDALDNMLETI